MGLWTDQASEAQKPSEASLWKPQLNGAESNMACQDGLLSPESHPTIRRLSSATASFDDLHLGPSVVVPPKHMQEPSDAHETAAALEIAKHRMSVAGVTEGTSTPTTPPETTTTDSYAFAFDIDGVLIRGGKPIPEAIEAMKVLNGQNKYGIKVPYIFLTNGGGKTEQERCVQLSRQMELEISPGQFICGHTPMKEMAEKYKTVLVVGGEGEKCRDVAEGYGFKDVVTPGDIMKDNERTTPFRKLTDQESQHSRKRNFAQVEIEAIFVFADSRHWGDDQQIIIDLLTSKNGRLGTRSEKYDEGPPIYFSHNDIIWSAEHEHTRLGMGALRTSLEAIYEGITGKKLISTAFGKPQLGTFQFATRLLQQWRKDTHGINKPPETVYFVGDTPDSDIRGTNEYNESDLSENDWYSILVRTGVFQEGTKPRFTPRATVDTVLDAVKHGIKREMDRAIKKKIMAQSAVDGEAVIEEHPATEAALDRE
ncbi:hypothetical protein OEA41_000728 [Lepraria neglecta]|uniref:Uncharacterized protein n=1 Tax=Lepraria neglecta TaxID=209136 RepID=A0AAD9ZGA9_9LECA|nr:hypothetical protein OEA41_000728 [Lepraria neglecta]